MVRKPLHYPRKLAELAQPDITPNVSFAECTTEMEELYKIHKHAILDAVHQVLKILVRLNQMFRGKTACILVRHSLTQLLPSAFQDEEEEQNIAEQVQGMHITQTLGLSTF